MVFLWWNESYATRPSRPFKMADSLSFSVSSLLLVVLLCPKQGLSLYEDQVGQMDWRKSYLGKVKFSHFDVSTHSSKRLFVATESNVLAALNSRTGQIMWRIVLEEKLGHIDALLHQGSFLVSISGGGKFVRSWDTGSGSLLWEAMMFAGPSPTPSRVDSVDGWNGIDATLVEFKGEKSIIILSANMVKSFLLQDGSELWSFQAPSPLINLHALSHSTGTLHAIGTQDQSNIFIHTLTTDKGESKTSRVVTAPWVGLENPSCIQVNSNLVCTDSSTLNFHVIEIDAEENQGIDIPLSSFTGETITGSKPKLQSLGSHTNSWNSRTEFVLHISENHHLLFKMDTNTFFKLLKEYHDDSIFFGTALNDRAILVSLTMKNQVIHLQCFDLDTSKELNDLAQKVKLDSSNNGKPVGLSVYVFAKKDQNIGYRVLLLTSDHAMSLIQQPGRIMWLREEALAGISAVDAVELPFSPSQANFDTLQEEFGSNPNDDVLSMFIRRIRAQAKQFQALVKQFQTFVNAQQGHAPAQDVTTTEDEQLTRDQFNLRKLILTVTDSGKIFGLDSLDGSILWQVFLPDLAPFSDNDKNFFLLYTQRTVAHFPLPAQCVVLGKSRSRGGTILHFFNPVNGKSLDEIAPQGTLLPFTVVQAMLLPQIDSKHAKILLMLDSEKNVHAFPDTKETNQMIAKQAKSLFFFLVNKKEGDIVGYMLQNTGTKPHRAQQMWNVHIPPSQQKITIIATKSPAEHVHSQGKVLGDRRVLYKYLNPNVISLGTEAMIDGKSSISIYFVDVVTGLIIHTNRHKNARGPIHMVHSENWVVYSLFNTKSRRHELVVMELYEGYNERNSTAFSSMDPPPQPIVLQQSYIFPTTIRFMTVTITEKGITHKNLLIGLQSGYILSLAKNFLDPRRTFNPTQEDREEGLYPYMPEITLNPLAFVNYNQTVTHIHGIHTAASGLESTCLVFTYGLDIFWIRVTPSRMFDVLKEDFDYWLIAGTLLILVLVTVISNRLASMKMLKQAWQ